MMIDRSILIVVLVMGALAGAFVAGTVILEPGDSQDSMVRQFNSTEDLKAFLEKNHQEQGTDGYGGAPGIFTGLARTESVNKGLAVPSAMPPMDLPDLSTGLSGDHSVTNVQVPGVDEADFVKNDGKYIYLVSGDELVIIDALPAEKAKIVSTTTLSGRPVEMFLSGDQVVIFATNQEQTMIRPKNSVAPVLFWRQVTVVTVYDVSDLTDPKAVREMAFSGSYVDSRMIGDYVYVVTSEPVQWYGPDPVIPMVMEGSAVTTPPVYYFDAPYESFVYDTISSFNLQDEKPAEAKTLLVGYSTTLYVSTDNLYIAYQKQIPYQQGEVIRPTAPGEANGSGPPGEGTIIHRFVISKGDVIYKATGDVPGHLLNQFSMDEDGGNMRVATTIEGWNSRGSYQYNNVYVLDPDMQTIGKLECIAPDEQIYSTRFVGDRLYMVTFKRIDPFFVIDLSDPENPNILGELKIPGFSDYLHPYDENHCIGVGKETEGNDWGGVSVSGLKLAFFDVTDVNNPKLIDKVEIGDSGTDSEALRDHKAFLFDQTRNLLVIPVSEVTRIYTKDYPGSSFTSGYWQGAYVFSVTPETGFVLKGKVTHGGEEKGYYWDSPDTVLRSLYMDNVLCTISQKSVVMSDLFDPGTELNRVMLPVSDSSLDYPWRGV
jgi:inhibitor of cysteine peptidase